MIAICNDPSGVMRTFFLLLKKQQVFVQEKQISEWLLRDDGWGSIVYRSIKNQEVHLPQKTWEVGYKLPQMIDFCFFFRPREFLFEGVILVGSWKGLVVNTR